MQAGGKVHDIKAVVDSNSAVYTRGGGEPVDFVFSLSHFFPPTPGQQLKQPPGQSSAAIASATFPPFSSNLAMFPWFL